MSAGYTKLRGRRKEKLRKLWCRRTLVVLGLANLGRGLSDMELRDHGWLLSVIYHEQLIASSRAELSLYLALDW